VTSQEEQLSRRMESLGLGAENQHPHPRVHIQILGDPKPRRTKLSELLRDKSTSKYCAALKKEFRTEESDFYEHEHNNDRNLRMTDARLEKILNKDGLQVRASTQGCRPKVCG
jgi:hypothetical protein